MSFDFESMPTVVKVGVVVVDKNHDIVYNNRVAAYEMVFDEPDLIGIVDEVFEGKCGLDDGRTILSCPSEDHEERHVSVTGDYLTIKGEEYVILTFVEMPEPGKKQSSIDEIGRRSSYIAEMSHEIRTPANAIVGFSRLLASTDDEVKKAKYVELIENNNRLLMQLVDDVLDFAKIDEGALAFTTKEVDVNEFIRSMDSTMRLRVSPQTMLNHVLGAVDCKIETDPERLSQVMLNLLNNACKFTSRGSITVGYELWPESIYFFVRDTGSGISAEKQQLLFRRFSKQNDDKPGNGLGLAICKEIVDALHGEIGVESAGEGKGSQFWFTLPVTPKEDIQEEVPVGEEEHSRCVSECLPSRDEHKHTILVAEDNDSNYLLVSSILEDEYNLVHAANGLEAVNLFAESRPDLVLMDISMPDMDGYEATRMIRRDDSDVPIIAVTAYAFQSDRIRIMESGFNGYVSKPIDAGYLLSEIRRYLKE